jgi:hypothetical protein
VKAAPKEDLPRFVEPMLASPGTALTTEGWAIEVNTGSALAVNTGSALAVKRVVGTMRAVAVLGVQHRVHPSFGVG